MSIKISLFNEQPAEKPAKVNGDNLDVVSVFHTIQGEGPFAGQPAVFVRLAGCNLQCPFCDTDYTTGRRLMKVGDLFGLIWETARKGHNTNLVVVTGGEPFRQDMLPLVEVLVKNDLHVQIETNGTLSPFKTPLPEDAEVFSPEESGVTIVCSPKSGTVNKELQPFVDYLKYVMEADHVSPEDGLPTLALGGVSPARPWMGFEGDIYLNPMDAQDEKQNQRNLKACADSCLKYGYTLGVQMHKLLGLP